MIVGLLKINLKSNILLLTTLITRASFAMKTWSRICLSARNAPKNQRLSWEGPFLTYWLALIHNFINCHKTNRFEVLNPLCPFLRKKTNKNSMKGLSKISISLILFHTIPIILKKSYSKLLLILPILNLFMVGLESLINQLGLNEFFN